MKPHIRVAGVALISATLVACGGGGGGTSFLATTPSAPTPTSTPAPPVTQAITLTSATPTTVHLSATGNGTSAVVTFPIVSANANASVTLQASLPAGAPQPQAVVVGAKVPSAIGGSNINALAYVLVTPDANTTIDHTPAFSFTTTSPVSGSTYVAMFDTSNPASGWSVILGSGNATSDTVTFASQPHLPPLVLKANVTYVFAFITASGATTPTPLPTYPGAAGASYSYAGSQTQTDSYSYPTPSPLPSTSVTSSVTSTVTVGSSPFPGGSAASLDLHQVLTDAGALASTITTTDSWYGNVSGASGAQYLALFGSASTDNANDTLSTTYTTPNAVDIIPETNNATWSNSAAGTTNATFADGETLARTDNADGSFTETTTDTLSHHYTFILQGNADGSGSYTGTAFTALGVQSLNVSAPSNTAITVTYLAEPTDAIPNPTPVVIAQPAAWFSAGTPLYAESDTESTNVVYPSSCAVPTQFGYTGTHVAQTIDRIDPMIGTHEHIVNDTYLGVLGPVCMTMSDTLTENYDYLLDTAGSFANFADFSGNATHVETIAQTLTLQTTSQLSSTASASRKAANGLSPTSISATRAQFALNVARLRHSVVTKIVKRFEAIIAKGGLK